MIRLSLIASLAAVSGCTSGTFCDLYEPITFPQDVAAVVVEGARDEAVKIDTLNGTYRRLCTGP